MKNNNKKIIYKLSFQSLKSSKMRNIFILITIMLSVSLLSGLVFFVYGTKEIERKSFEKRQHVIYEDVTQEQIQQIKQEERITNATEYKWGKSFEVDHYVLIPYYLEQEKSSFFSLDIIKGKYPENINEVLVDEKLLELHGLKKEVGETLTIHFLDGSIEEFKVSGILSSTENTNLYYLYLSKNYALKGKQLEHIPFSIAARIQNAEQMKAEEFKELIRSIGKEYNVERHNINENNQFVRSLHYDRNELSVLSVVGLAILLVSVLVIYSIFYISISERTRQFGQLRTMGMTKKQIRKMVKIEGAVLSIVGSLGGIFMGALAVYGWKPQGFRVMDFAVGSLIIMVADYITVRTSLTKPANMAANISPIEASKISGYEYQKWRSKSKKLYRKLSPISLSLIAANGNYKKTWMTMISLGFSGILFLCASTYINSINQEAFSRQGWFEYGEFVINLSGNAAQMNDNGYTGLQADNPFNELLIKEIKKMEGVQEVMELKSLEVTFDYHDLVSNDLLVPISKEETKKLETYLDKGTSDYEKMVEKKEIYINSNKIAQEIYGWKFETGDEITLRWFNGESYVEDIFTIAGEVNLKVFQDPELFKPIKNAGWFLIPEDLLREMMIPGFNLNNRLIIRCTDYEKFGDYVGGVLEMIQEENPTISLSTLKEQVEHSQQQFESIKTTVLGAVFFVIVFSLLSFINTLITNVKARKKELASLRTLGMSEKQMADMIRWEGIYYAVVNIFITGTIGTLCSYLLIQLFHSTGIDYMIFKFPWIQLIGYIGFILLIPLAISNIVLTILRRKTLVERLYEIE